MTFFNKKKKYKLSKRRGWRWNRVLADKTDRQRWIPCGSAHF